MLKKLANLFFSEIGFVLLYTLRVTAICVEILALKDWYYHFYLTTFYILEKFKKTR